MTYFIKVTQINPQHPDSEGIVIRININKIIKYNPSHRGTACIHLDNRDCFDVSESPDDIDHLIADAKFNDAIETGIRSK